MIADCEGAQKAYDRAIELDASHPGALLRKGRLMIERALIERAKARDDESWKERAIELAREGAKRVRLGAETARGKERMEVDIARAYVAVIDGWGTPASIEPGPLLEKWRGETGMEEFLLVEGLAKGGDAMRDAARALVEQMPSWPLAWFWRGVARNDKGDLDGAISDYDEALRIDPHDAAAQLNRGLARQAKGDLDGAAADFEQALRINSRSADAYGNRGLVRKARGISTAPPPTSTRPSASTPDCRTRTPTAAWCAA